MAKNYVPFDVYGKTDTLDESTIQVMATRLEARGSHPEFDRMMHEYFDAMEIDQAQTVLDLGCGTGVAARALAKRPHFNGKITGIDLSSHLIETATQLAAEENVADRINFQVGDTRSLNIPDDTFDAVIAHTLISHVDAYQQAVNEMARIVKPQGCVAIFDGDYASLTFGHPDPTEGTRIDDLIIKGIITQPYVMRQLPRVLKSAGLEIDSKFAYVVCEMGHANFWASGVQSFRNLLPIAGVMSKEEATQWADDRLKESEDGLFFGSSNYLTYIARKA